MTEKSLFLRNIWYYAFPSHQLNQGRSVVKTLLTEEILFERTEAGKVTASQHQKHTAARSYPTCEVQGNIWIYIADEGKSYAIEAVPEVPYFGNQTHQLSCTMRFPSSIDHAVVGLVDPAHVAFVHQAWWWRSPVQLNEVVKTFDPSPYGFTMRRHPLEQQTFLYRLLGRNPEVEISFQLPGIRIESISTNQHQACNLTTATPISETETEVTNLLYTTLPWVPLLKPLLSSFMHSFLAQDREVLSKQQIGLQYDPSMTLVGDADAQARWYYRLKREFAAAAEAGRPFVNPIQPQTLSWRS
ncbi:aromatic ring-hydroxylating dioxygenase subunit alpha [Pseudanabaena sp. FACHB-2040]|uniref:aromatic ring-hydroxylating dioxygenase subunit alpha n=1 Tax=Pseudanabaena sp. FACHB-2040 TaxID=2692859 RepID=UPI001683259C|nr:aromatic ring-hydroxylating dioxygenase subunit alpha [Pseudanabaena sp. FACHB-2040]MBD2261017.1 aromatic ring-hydroxylating dioxygenase subunit alpha [Pseudanabaena sp. FACHB-2040]